jgi:hypothetical protein
MNVGEFERNPVRDFGFLAAGGDKQEILLPVVEEPEACQLDVGGRGALRPVDRL